MNSSTSCSKSLIDRTRELNYSVLCFQTALIVMIVASHVGGMGFDGPLNMFPLLSYFVQGFAFISGYLYSVRYDSEPYGYFLSRVKRLLVPAVFIYFAYGVLVTFLRGVELSTFGQPITLRNLFFGLFADGEQYGLNAPMWFIGPFFLAQCTNVLFRFAIFAILRRGG